jgi:glycosyltransferase involved in cell wall biosynthesis
VVPVRDATALADAIGRLSAESELRARLGAAARVRARERFARPVVWAAQEEFYRSVLGD